MVRQLRANRTLIAGQSYADRQAGMIQVRRKAVTCTYPSRVRCKEVTCTYLSQVHFLADTYPSRVRILAGTYPSRVHILAPSIPNSICANFYIMFIGWVVYVNTIKFTIHIVLGLPT